MKKSKQRRSTLRKQVNADSDKIDESHDEY